MALYEYNCPNCGNTFDKRVPMAEVKQRIKCPKCKKMAKKTLGNFAVVGLADVGFDDGSAPWDDDGGGMDGAGEMGDVPMDAFAESGMPDMGHSHGEGGHTH